MPQHLADLNFDRLTGDLWESDVGENTREEVNKVIAGGNYGWGEMEGTMDGILPGDGTTIPGLVRPVVELQHTTESNSISGGFVYRGSAIPELYGKYVFADLGQGYSTAALLYASVDPADPLYGQEFEFKFAPGTPMFNNGVNNLVLPQRIYSFGEDYSGELYFMAGPDPRSGQVVPGPAFIVKLTSGYNAADFNRLNGVDAADLTQLTTNFEQSPRTNVQGDADLDSDVDGNDFLLWQRNLGATTAVVNAEPVPEPASAALLAIVGLSLAYRQRRRVSGRPNTR